MRSLTTGTPNGRCSFVPGLGIQTLRAGCGWYWSWRSSPCRRSCSLVQFSFICPVVCPSVPALPPFNITSSRLAQIVRIPDFVPEAEPYCLFLAFGQAIQHTFGPDTPFHPRPSIESFSGLFRKEAGVARSCHCHRSVFGCRFLHVSTFLRPLAPRSLPASSLLRTL